MHAYFVEFDFCCDLWWSNVAWHDFQLSPFQPGGSAESKATEQLYMEL